ncbi:MAG: AraC family transcriptional regulator [Allosphingosinicella sp.]
MPQVRATALSNYCEVARAVGLDPYALLSRARINPQVLEQPDHPISATRVAALLEQSARQSGCPWFGLLMAEARPLSAIGPVSLLLAHQNTARDLIEGIVRYRSLLSDAITIDLEEDNAISVIRTNVLVDSAGPQSIELLTGILCRIISETVGGSWHPESAHFVHAAPSELRVHRRIFRCSLVFESEFNGLACPSASLDAPNPAADSTLTRYAEQYLALLAPKPTDGSIAEKTRRSIHLLLPSGRANLEQVGANLGLQPRTLQRLLERENRSFGSLLNDVRRELALRYLAVSSHSVSSIALMTGYASPSSFTRWFCAEFGTAPAAWRAAGRQLH